MRVAIVDGYTDEPAALGVPPYLAPLPRYVAGAAIDAGATEVGYITIDDLRARGSSKGKGEKGKRALKAPPGKWDLLVVVGGAVVPGRYLRGRPASARELGEVAEAFQGPSALVGPVARWGWTSGAPTGRSLDRAFDHVAEMDGDAYVLDLMARKGRPSQRKRLADEWARWPVLGASIASSHPDHPRPLIAEVETYRGCVRHASGGCSFCTTVRDGPPVFRPVDEVAAEVRALAAVGVVAFRLGGQSCIYSYMVEGVGEDETPRPSPSAIGALLDGVRGVAPGLEVLHVDNANPAVIAAHPDESAEITCLLVERCTGGNVVALGLESADPAVKDANNLNATREECLDAVRLINRHGNVPTSVGLPALLPGINFLAGLRGETERTFQLDLDFLADVLREGLLLRRINIRQVAPVCGPFDASRNRRAFRSFRSRVREEVDRPMLRELLPYGSLLRGIWTEVHDGSTTFGRLVGSYPIVVGIPARLELGSALDVRVVGYGYRSVTAVPSPLPVNECPMSLLTAVPGIGRKRAARIMVARPIRDPDHLRSVLDDPSAADALITLLK